MIYEIAQIEVCELPEKRQVVLAWDWLGGRSEYVEDGECPMDWVLENGGQNALDEFLAHTVICWKVGGTMPTKDDIKTDSVGMRYVLA